MKDFNSLLLISFVKNRFEDGDYSGVPRFDWELRKVFSNLVSLSDCFYSRLYLFYLSLFFSSKTVVITCNELSLAVPKKLNTIVVHHGIAQTHFDRDEQWRDSEAQLFCHAQEKMYKLPNRIFVSPSMWCATEFSNHYNVKTACVIPHWVEPIKKDPIDTTKKPIILGDWRSYNKGDYLIDTLKERMPHVEFLQLKCTYYTRMHFYKRASGYLSLSLSEGANYSMADAESAKIPILSTDVGLAYEFNCNIISWKDRDNIDLLENKLTQLLTQSKSSSFYDTWTFDDWSDAWKKVVSRFYDSH
tara:strand:- start:2805 stop:3710 length:906 start_codon:yes stop_codon:yes gene_type:complete